MSKISNPVVSDTFSTWLTAANKSYSRLNQFAVTESALYANTITANVSLVMSGGATFKGQALDDRFANTVNLNLKQSVAVERAALANTNTYIATKASQADHLAALANTNSYIAAMSTDVQLANTNLAVAQLNTNLLSTNTAIRLLSNQGLANTNAAISNLNTNLTATNTAIRLLNTNTQSALDTQEALEATHLANTNAYIATQATAIADIQNGYNFTGAVGVTGTLTANAVTIDHGDLNISGSGNRAISVNSATGSAGIELGGPSGAGIDFKQPFSDDYDLRIGSTGGTGGYINTAGGVLAIGANTTFSRLVTHTANTTHNDNVRAFFGTGNDLSIHMDGSNSYISDLGTGGLYLQGDGFLNIGSPSGETGLSYTKDGAVDLYYDNVSKFVTTSTGVQIKGNANGAVYSTASATGSVALDYATYTNFHLILTGNLTLSNPSTEVSGTSGLIFLKQDGSGSRTLSLGTDYESPAGAGFTLTTTGGATDIIPYYCVQPGRILLGQIQRAFS